jgi:ribonucleoside-diphosphate reductase alpha chain
MYQYASAFEKCVSYFEGDELAAKVFLDKYALKDNNSNLLEETPVDMHHRLAKEFARIEAEKYTEPLSEEQIFSLFDKSFLSQIAMWLKAQKTAMVVFLRLMNT